MAQHPLANEQFINLETRRVNGERVGTTVWFAEHAGEMYIVTPEASGKAKRLRRDPNVRVAACDQAGVLTGPWLSGRARFAPLDEALHAYRLLDQKYNLLQFMGWQEVPAPGRVILAVALDPSTGVPVDTPTEESSE